MCKECHEDEWHFTKLQPTITSPTVTLAELDSIMDAGLDSGMFCSGPTDPWSATNNVGMATSHVTYWIPRAVLESASSTARQMLRAQVSNCPIWAFSMPQHRVCFLVHLLL